MALTLTNTVVASGIVVSCTTTGVSIVSGYTKELGVSVAQVGTASTAASWCAQISFDGGSTYYDHAGTSQAGISAGTAAATYSWTVPLPATSTHVRLVFVQQAGGTSSTLNAQAGSITGL